MSWSVFLCDRQWKVHRILRESAHLPIQVGDNLKSYMADADKLNAVEDFEASSENMLQLQPVHSDKKITALMYTYPKYFVVVLSLVENLNEVTGLEEECVKARAWADCHLQIPYGDTYYEIQQMNNQLVNSERALMKTNQRLKRAMEEIQRANDTISVLERDELTGLYRLNSFEKKGQALLTAHPEGRYHLIVLNLSRFRVINEFFGKKAGDQLLQKLAVFLIGLAPKTNCLLARGASATFYLLVPSDSSLYQKLGRQLPEFFSQYPLPNHIQAHMGVAEREAGEDVSLSNLCERAMLALDFAQNRPDVSVVFYNRSLQDQIADNHRILDGIQEAIVGRELKMYLQQKVDMTTGEVVGAEGLIRWEHPVRGMISPAQFIPLLEREDSIYEVDQYIWEEACKVLHQRAQMGKKELPISVNIARNDLYRSNLLDTLKNLVKKYNVSPHLLHLEILERSYVKDFDVVLQKVQDFRKEGFVIEMDDFGTGESSLSLLSEMPVDILKLDRSFLIKALTDSRRSAVIQCIIQLAQTLELGVIAEGVENNEQAELLMSLGCRYAQGFYYSKPQPSDTFLAVD